MVPLPILAQVLTHMKNSGLIQYEHDPHDGESKLILLTKLAYDCMPAVRKAFQQSDEDMIQGFASSQVEALVAMLRRVLDTVERRSEDRRVGKARVSTCRYRGWPYH